MRAWHFALIAIGGLWLYEYTQTHPAQVGRAMQVFRPRYAGGIVNETNSSLPAGQTTVAGEPDMNPTGVCY